MIHDQLDLSRWVNEFPLEKLRNDARDFVRLRQQQLPGEYPDHESVERHIALMSPGGEIIVGPESIAVNIQLRDQAFAGIAYSGRRVPTDIFLWAKGEPRRRCSTKVGGIPYWSNNMPWPRESDGHLSRFIAQICFADSIDIIGALPGQVLLIFGDNDALLEPERLLFKWLPLGINDVIVDVPVTDDEEFLTPFHGVIYRTEDWPDSVPALKGKYKYPEHIAVMEGTKIGGIPSWIQDEEPLPGRFIASLGTISVDVNQRWPFINASESRGWNDSDHDLTIGDMGTLYLFMDSTGAVRAISQCY
jgi:hypothetical protein